MENIMMLPASYCVMNEEEMTYTTGGASAIQAIAAWVFPPYAWLAGVTAIRDYRKKNPDTWTQDGLDYFANDMGKSVSNFLYDLACASWVLGTSATGIGLVINAAIILITQETPKNNKGGGSSRKGRAAALFLSVHTKAEASKPDASACLWMC